jgi:acetyltransferase-like isoleucine patch superfamily enzyme
MRTMADEALFKRYPNVQLGERVLIDEFCVLGHPARGREPGSASLVIGDDAVIRSHTVLYGGVRIGARFQSGHWVLVREDTVIGDDCSIGSGSVIEFSVRIDDGVRLHSQCFVPEHSVLEAGCWLGPRVVITNARFPAGPRTKSSLEPVLIRKGAKICANSTLLPGIVIGAGSLVGAGSVVTRDVPDGAVVRGNPARLAGLVSELRDKSGPVYSDVS